MRIKVDIVAARLEGQIYPVLHANKLNGEFVVVVIRVPQRSGREGELDGLFNGQNNRWLNSDEVRLVVIRDHCQVTVD